MAVDGAGGLGRCLVRLHFFGRAGHAFVGGHVVCHLCGGVRGCHGLAQGYFASPVSGFGHGLSGVFLVVGHGHHTGLGLVAALGLDRLDLSHARVA